MKDINVYDLNTPEALLEFMSKNIEYGYIDKNENKHKNDLENMYKDYFLQYPNQVWESKIGVCWDQTGFEDYIFNEYIKYPHSLFYIEQINPMSSTHTFLVYKRMNKYYYFENSYEKLRGIHEVKDENEAIDIVVKNMREDNPDAGIKVRKIPEIRSGFNCLQFMNYCISYGKTITNPDGVYDYSDKFRDIEEVVNSLSEKEKRYITNGDFRNSPYSVYRRVYLCPNKEPMGFLELYSIHDKTQAYVVIVVKPKFRGKGLSEVMVRDAINASYDIKGIKKLVWGAHKDNKISNIIAKKMGFKIFQDNDDDNQYDYNLKRYNVR